MTSEVLLELSTNDSAKKIKKLQEFGRLAFPEGAPSFRRAENMPEEHQLILDAIESGNAEAARSAADVHIDRLKELVIREGVQQRHV